MVGLSSSSFLVLIVGAIAIGGSYNRLVGMQQNVDAKWAQVQNVYQRRADLIPNLVNTVAGAANFEKSTLGSGDQCARECRTRSTRSK